MRGFLMTDEEKYTQWIRHRRNRSIAYFVLCTIVVEFNFALTYLMNLGGS